MVQVQLQRTAAQGKLAAEADSSTTDVAAFDDLA